MSLNLIASLVVIFIGIPSLVIIANGFYIVAKEIVTEITK